MADRIVVTGMGAISPLGLSSEESWRNAVKGKSGVGPITLCDTDGILVKIAAEVKGFQPELYMPVKEVRRRDRFEQFGAAAAREAIRGIWTGYYGRKPGKDRGHHLGSHWRNNHSGTECLRPY